MPTRRFSRLVLSIVAVGALTSAAQAAVISPSTSPANAALVAGCFPSWQIVPTPAVSESIWGIDGVSATDFWAVGDETPSGEPTLLHWDGSTWTSSSTGAQGVLNGVDVLAQDDAWAVGGQTNSPLTVHWDGSTWTKFPAPPPPHRTAVLYGVASTSSSDVWAVGSSGQRHGFVLHWDGATWSSVPSPSHPGGEELRGVFASSPTDAWAVGDRGILNPKPIIIHWDGTSWQDSRIPPVSGGGLLFGISGSGGDDIWAAGTHFSEGTLALHWNGLVWSRMQLPYRHRADLRGVSDLAPDDVWVGGYKDASGPPVALHWNGTKWDDTFTVHENQWFNTIKAFDHTHVWAAGGGAAGIRVEEFVPCGQS